MYISVSMGRLLGANYSPCGWPALGHGHTSKADRYNQIMMTNGKGGDGLLFYPCGKGKGLRKSRDTLGSKTIPLLVVIYREVWFL